MTIKKKKSYEIFATYQKAQMSLRICAGLPEPLLLPCKSMDVDKDSPQQIDI